VAIEDGMFPFYNSLEPVGTDSSVPRVNLSEREPEYSPIPSYTTACALSGAEPGNP
jgi:hypothetical protein